MCLSVKNITETESSTELLFIVRLFSEISIKSSPVRKRWTKHLAENIRALVRRVDERASVRQEWDRLEVRIPSASESTQSRIVEVLKNTPGIANFSQVTRHAFSDMHDIYTEVHKIWADSLADKTFCVRAKRSGKHDFTSTQLEQYVGGGLRQNSGAAGVNLKHPQVTVNIEVRDDTCYIVAQKHRGLGGFPVGTQEPVLSLVSGGFDSTVASFLCINRGMRTHFCFFNLGGKAHELAVKEIIYYLWNKYGSTHKVRFISVPFEPVVEEILEKIHPSNMGVVLKRMMLRAAEKLSAKGGVQALVTGEAIAQVSSQTLHNLKLIDSVSDQLVLRPLITMDKPAIIDLARQIGVEDFSASIPEYCGVISVKPSARVNAEKLFEQEQLFDFSLIDLAVDRAQVQLIDKVMENLTDDVSVELVSTLPPEGVLVDIRHPDEQALKPLKVGDIETLFIPFYQLGSKVTTFDADREYFLYCEKGVMSELHASHLIDQGLTNIKVYRP